MKWIIKLSNEKNKRILVEFDPIKDILIFKGQYKIDMVWTDFTIKIEESYGNLDIINEDIIEVGENLNKVIDIYEDLDKSFSLIKEIEITTIDKPI